MSSFLPEGFRSRDATEGDVAVAAAILQAEEHALRGDSIWGVEDTIDFWRHIDPDGSWIVESADGTPAAFAAAIVRDEDIDSWAAVHPSFGGNGLATSLLRKLEQHARDLGARQLKVGAFAENAAAVRLFEQLGYAEVRRYYQMRIELDTPPDPPEWPEGIEPSTFRPEDARAFHAALGEAFAEEWGWHGLAFEEWERTRLNVPDVDVSLWFVARDGQEIAGVARCDPKQNGGGWIGALGVRKAWRKRGLGLALLRQAFVEFHRRGEPHVGLGVDAQNPTGATRLYEKAGMRVRREDVIYEKALS